MHPMRQLYLAATGMNRGKTTFALAAIRAACRVRNATLRDRLAALTAAGQLVRGVEGYRLAAG